MLQPIKANFATFSMLLTFVSFATIAPQTDSPQTINLDETPKGISTPEWQSIQTQIKRGKYKANASYNGSYTSFNPKHGWRIDYHRDGTTTLSPYQKNNDHNSKQNYLVALRLNAISFHKSFLNNSLPAQPQRISTDEQRINYHWNNNITEYWINSEAQLEQWFEIKKRPVQTSEYSDTMPLTVSMTLDTQLPVSLQNNQLSIGSITYNKLKVWDSNGTIIPATMAYQNHHLNLVIDDIQASYPLTIDPSFTQQAYIKASNTDVIDNFGFSVAVSGDTIIVGAPGEDSNTPGVNGDESDNSADGSGAAYVFVRNSEGVWSQQAYLKASNSDAGDRFGGSVSISGDTIVVGASGEDSNAIGVNGDESDNSVSGSGAVYVFVRDKAGVWSQQAYLKASNTESNDDFFGSSLDISGDTLVVGAAFEDSNATGVNSDESDNSADASGAAYAFVRDNSSVWSQQAYLKASNTGAIDFFGNSVAISGDTVIVGAYREDSNATGVNGDETNSSATDSGAAYVFVRDSVGVWSQQAYLKASNTSGDDEFGYSVAISGDTVVVGALNEDSGATGVNGNETDNSELNSGAVYVFMRNSSNVWSQQAYLKASNTNFLDNFSFSVSISDDTIVVGARLEDSNATGVNGDDSNSLASQSGAAYVFVRDSSDDWSQQAYLKASNTDAVDTFGYSVAISGDTVVVGSPFEDSNSNGVNGEESNNLSFNSGAVYVYGTSSYFINGTVTGLTTGNSITLQNNGGDNLLVNVDGIFSFSTPITDGASYDVTVLTQPTSPDQTCTISSGSGTIAGGDVTDVAVICSVSGPNEPLSVPTLSRWFLLLMIAMIFLGTLTRKRLY